MHPQRNDELADRIADLIADRGLPPGAPLPAETILMDDLGVGRTSIRESLKALQALGIVDIRHGRGTFVGTGSSEALHPWLLFRTRIDTVTQSERLQDLLDLREIIESELARRVAGSHSEQLITDLSDCVRRMSGERDESAAADREFHELLCQAAGIELAVDLIRVFWGVYRETGREIIDPIYTRRSIAGWHAAIVDAIAAKDPDATAVAVRHHYDQIRQSVTDRD